LIENDENDENKKNQLGIFNEFMHRQIILSSSSYWLPCFSLPLHAVLYPWAKSRNLIISSPSFNAMAVRSLEIAIKVCSTDLLKQQQHHHQGEEENNNRYNNNNNADCR